MIFGFDPEKYRKDFPMLSKPIIYFDNACMSLKPVQVVDKMNEYYREHTACGGRSAHRLARKVEDEVDRARNEVRDFINAKRSEEVIFTRNTTESINIVANSLGLAEGDEVIIQPSGFCGLCQYCRIGKTHYCVNAFTTGGDGPDNVWPGAFAQYMKTLESPNDERAILIKIIVTNNLEARDKIIKALTVAAALHD